MAKTKITARWSSSRRARETGFSFVSPKQRSVTFYFFCEWNTHTISQTISVTAARNEQEDRVRRCRHICWLKEVRKYQKTVDFLIPRQPFQRLVRELSQDYKVECKFDILYPHTTITSSFSEMAISCSWGFANGCWRVPGQVIWGR